MSKIFKISGNFMEDGEWAQPDPSFTGEIVVDDDNTFHGYCNVLHDTDMPVLNKTRYLAGTIAPNGRNGKEGIAFYKLSNYHNQAPLMYIIPELGKCSEGEWGALYCGTFFMVDKARVEIEEVTYTYSIEDEKRIRTKYDELDKTINCHDRLLEQIQCCIDILTNAR